MRGLCPLTGEDEDSDQQGASPAWVRASSHCPAPPGPPWDVHALAAAPKEGAETPPCHSVPLPGDTGGSSAAAQNSFPSGALLSSLSARNEEAGACDCPRYSKTLPKTDAHRVGTCLGNAGSAGTGASPPPAAASDALKGLQAGAEPQEPSKAHTCHKYQSGFSELEQLQWGNSEPRGNLAPAPPGAHGSVLGAESSSSIPTDMPGDTIPLETQG